MWKGTPRRRCCIESRFGESTGTRIRRVSRVRFGQGFFQRTRHTDGFWKPPSPVRSFGSPETCTMPEATLLSAKKSRAASMRSSYLMSPSLAFGS